LITTKKSFLKHIVVKNAIALYWIEIASFIIPFITVPYLSRVLGPEKWGMLIFAQSFAFWFSMVIDYGFQLSASREIAKNREDRNVNAGIVAGVHGAKAIFIIFSGIFIFFMFFLIEKFQQNSLFLIGAWLLSISQGLDPIWFFQGVEKLKKLSMIYVLGRMISVVSIIFLVHNPNDAYKVLFIQAFFLALSYGLCIYLLYKEVDFRFPKLIDIINAVKIGWSMFLFRASVSLYTASNSFILGLFVPSVYVSYFGSAERISKVPLRMMGPITDSLYPRINYLMSYNPQKAKTIAQISLIVFAIVGLVVGGFTFFFSPFIVDILLGPGYESAVPVLKILSALIPLIAISNVLGKQWMLPNNLDSNFNKIIICAGLINILFALMLAPAWKAKGMAMAVVISECFVTVSMLLTVKNHKRFF
jgi:PST family polysaccharide transporter